MMGWADSEEAMNEEIMNCVRTQVFDLPFLAPLLGIFIATTNCLVGFLQ